MGLRDQTGDRPQSRRASGTGLPPMGVLLLALGGLCLLCLSASTAYGASPQTRAVAVPQPPPLILPGEAGTSSATPRSPADRWIVGGSPGPRSSAIAARHGATPIDGGLGSFRVPREGASALARDLARAGLLEYAEPDSPMTRSGYPSDLWMNAQWWLGRIVDPATVTPPAVSPDSPLIALIEESLDPEHPDLAGADLSGAVSLGLDADWHGTAVASIIGSPGEMAGIRGVWPGARMRLFASGLTCSSASRAVMRAANRGAAVINMSYTFPARVCFTHFRATQHAVRKGALPVAAAGNSGNSGNAPMRPATDPHVLSVGAVDSELRIAPFSTRNSRVDLVAPGVDVLAPTVGAGTRPGSAEHSWAFHSGTSFAAPMVSAAAAWLAQDRPRLTGQQIAGALTRSARELGGPGRDPAYGEGLLNIEGSLAVPDPPVDPLEPNDDIRWLDGSLIRPRAPFLWRAGKPRGVSATLSRAKDPADVYRVLVPSRRRVVINVAQIEGDIVLSALKPGARSIYRPRGNLIVRSNRPYPKVEGIAIRNLRKRPQSVWVAVTPSPRETGNDFRYRIRVARR